MEEKKAVTIENVGPMRRLHIPLPESGVVVLRGRNGLGKSLAIGAVDSALTGRGKPPVRDGARRALVEAAGVRMTIGRAARRTGEAEVRTLDGRLDVSDLVDPGLVDPSRADQQRIRALIQLAAADGSVEPFLARAPEIAEAVGERNVRGDDALETAKNIKAALHERARGWEREAAALSAKAEALASEAGDEPKEGEDTEAALERALADYQQAMGRKERLAGIVEAEVRARGRAVAAQQALSEMEAPDLEKAQAEADASRETVEKLEKALVLARERSSQAAAHLAEAKKLSEQRRRLAEIISAPEAAEDSSEAAERAEHAAAEALRRLDEAQKAHQSAQTRAKARAAGEKARRAKAQAEAAREAARAVDDVLSDKVAGISPKMRVRRDRLEFETGDRGWAPFAEMSHGQKWRAALEIAVAQVGRGGLITVKQEAWDGMDSENRADVARAATEAGVVILTAEASDEDAMSIASYGGPSDAVETD